MEARVEGTEEINEYDALDKGEGMNPSFSEVAKFSKRMSLPSEAV